MAEGEIPPFDRTPTQLRKEPEKVGRISIVTIPIEKVNTYLDKPNEFKKLIETQFPGNNFFKANSQYGFRGTRWISQKDKTYRATEEALAGYKSNLENDGIEFSNQQTGRPAGIYLQIGENEESYERSVSFALGPQEVARATETFKAARGDVGAFSIYEIRKDGGSMIIDREAFVYPGQESSNKKFVPTNGKSWKELIAASLVFQIV